MFDSEAIDIAIGLVFFYLILSLLVTTINELISSMFQLRGRHLKAALSEMLEHRRKKKNGEATDETALSSMLDKFYDHPGIQMFGKKAAGIRSLFIAKYRQALPSYIRTSHFSSVIVDLIKKSQASWNHWKTMLDAEIADMKKAADGGISKMESFSAKLNTILNDDRLKKAIAKLGPAEQKKINTAIQSLTTKLAELTQKAKDVAGKAGPEIDAEIEKIKTLVDDIFNKLDDIAVLTDRNTIKTLLSAFGKDAKEIALGEDKNVGDAAGEDISNLEAAVQRLDIHQDTKNMLLKFAREAGNNLHLFEHKIQNWFDTTMERAAGWYARKARYISLGVGFLIAVIFNADTFWVVRKLSHDSEARQKMVAAATDYVAKAAPLFEPDTVAAATKKNAAPAKSIPPVASANDTAGADSSHANTGDTSGAAVAVLSAEEDSIRVKDSLLYARIQALAMRTDTLLNENLAFASQVLGLGRTDLNQPTSPDYCTCAAKELADLKGKVSQVKDANGKMQKACLSPWCAFKCYAKRFGGWLVTAVALALGAPFWFDLLKKLVSIRSAGKNPQEEAAAKKTVG